MDEVLAAGDLVFAPGGTRLEVATAADGVLLILKSDDGELVAEAHVARDALSKQVREYVDIVRQMESAEHGRGSARVEALDMAKKLTHDDAARALKVLAAPLAMNHDTSRRLFSLLFSLRVDTSKLTGYRSHRPVR